VDKAIKVGHLSPAACASKTEKIHGFTENPSDSFLRLYGSDEEGIRKLILEDPELGQVLLSRLPNIRAEVIWAVRNEMARTVEDVLARRLRILFLDAKAAIDMSPVVARLMAAELGLDKEWQESQVQAFKELASRYLLEPYISDLEKILI
jgi:glycerol-3-phosphate dehydrogenase